MKRMTMARKQLVDLAAQHALASTSREDRSGSDQADEKAALQARLAVAEIDRKRAVEEKEAALSRLANAQASLEEFIEEREAMQAAIEELQANKVASVVGTEQFDDTSAFQHDLRASQDNFTLVGTEHFDDISVFYGHGDQRMAARQDNMQQALLGAQLAEVTTQRDALQAEVEQLRQGLLDGLRGSGLMSVEELLAEREGMKFELKKLQVTVCVRAFVYCACNLVLWPSSVN